MKRKLADPILRLLKQGVSPQALALAVTMGFVLAIVPVFGSSTILCLAFIAILRLNPLAVLLVNQVAYPLQFIFYLPFIRAGERLFRAPELPFSIPQIFEMFRSDLPGAVEILWWSTMYALVAWLLFSVLLGPVVYAVFRFVYIRISSKTNTKP